MTRPPPAILIAPQAFKGSLGAHEVAQAIEIGIQQGWCNIFPDSAPPQCRLIPLADGGEGTLDALVLAAGPEGSISSHFVHGPLPGQQLQAQIGWLDHGTTAIVEMAQAAGLPLVPPGLRNPERTTTYGVGELIANALDRGAVRIIVALGGSATNDGGAGMAQALGIRLLDRHGQDLAPGGLALRQLDRIDISNCHPRLATIDLIGLTDVTNPLTGSTGATRVYGPQKGASASQVAALDDALAHFASIAARDLSRFVATVPGAGAAGGLGAGLLAFGPGGTKLQSGADAVLAATHIHEALTGVALLITGEGRVDHQIAYGKVTGKVAQIAKAQGIPVWLVAGSVGQGYEEAYALGVSALIVASDGPATLDDAMRDAAKLIESSIARACRLWLFGKSDAPH